MVTSFQCHTRDTEFQLPHTAVTYLHCRRTNDADIQHFPKKLSNPPSSMLVPRECTRFPRTHSKSHKQGTWESTRLCCIASTS
ncbi:hypothetical protein PAXRUDRAFT_419908 [Paxillus rubicundulus Ve08.2h10]|uniref:Uncharacterized protein n=1 Tax=Paxillus rubicundulus Ve08.2h10 TaxID=930991 RepID=A0A0D0DXR0_9AGAM|nr:hypothetical protein PAXRUDRAFT_419908 [Paxillus rubicundulus Ve08.2h10]